MKKKSFLLSLVSILTVLVLLAPAAPALAAPLAPANLAATVTAGPPLGVALTWTDVAGEAGYRVKRAVAPGATFTDITAGTNGLPANSVTFTDATVTAGVTYSYQVVAFDATGDSPASNTVTVTASLPAAPTGLTAVAAAGPPQAVNLSWTDNSDNEIGFRIERATNAGFTASLVKNVRAANAALAPVTFTDNDTIPGVTFFYRVSALGPSGASAPSNAASVAVPIPPGMAAGEPQTIPGFATPNGYPLFYQDTLGQKVSLLPIDPVVNAADPPDPANAYSQALGFGAEAFYWMAINSVAAGGVNGLLEFAFEAIWANAQEAPFPGTEAVQARTRIRLDVPVSGNYSIQTPYGTRTFTDVVAGAAGFDINFTEDVGVVARVFSGPNSPIQPQAPVLNPNPINIFLRQANPPAGLIGDGVTIGPVTGATFNAIAITGPGVSVTAAQTQNNWTVNGRLLAAPVAPSFTMSVNHATRTATLTDTSTGTPTAWAWDFGDGATSNLQNPSRTFAAGGNFIVKLTASNAGGSGTASQMVSIFATPVASFTNTAGAGANTVAFTDTSTGNVTGWLWDFGDGATSTLKNPSHTFAAAGTFNVTLRIFNPAGTAVSAPKAVPVGNAPAAPGGLTAVLNAGPPITVTLNWTDNATDEASFRVERSVNNFATQATALTPAPAANATTFIDTNPPLGATVSYRVLAVNAAGASAPSNTASANTPSAPGAPPAPANLLAALVQGTLTVNLTWTDTATDETGFRVERSVNNFATGETLTPAPAANATTFQDTTAPAGATVSYRVFAINAAGASPASNVASVATPSAAGAPAAPTVLTAVTNAGPPVTVSLTWTDNASNETGFRVERSVNSFATAGTALTPAPAANATTFTDTNPPAGTTVQYRVIAVGTAGNSAPSNMATATIPAPAGAPAAPGNLTASAAQGPPMVVNLSWTDNSTDETGFRIERSVDGFATAGTLVTAALAANATTFQDTTAPPGATVSYRVFAVNAAGSSPASNTFTVTTPTPIGGAVQQPPPGGAGAPAPGGGGGGGGGGAAGGGGGAAAPSAPTAPATIETMTAGSAPLALNASNKTEKALGFKDEAGAVKIIIAGETLVSHKANLAVTKITVNKVAAPPKAPRGRVIVAAFKFEPEGAQFTPAINLTFKIPAGTNMANVRVVFLDGSDWVGMGGAVDSKEMTITVQVSHFSTLAVMADEQPAAAQPPAPTPTPMAMPKPALTPTPMATMPPAVAPAPKATPAPKPVMTPAPVVQAPPQTVVTKPPPPPPPPPAAVAPQPAAEPAQAPVPQAAPGAPILLYVLGGAAVLALLLVVLWWTGVIKTGSSE